MIGPGIRRGLRWGLAIAIAVAALGAFTVRAGATGVAGLRESMDAARLVGAAILAVGAAVAATRASRSEAIGLGLATATLVLAVAADRAVLRWLPGGGDVARRLLLASGLWSLAVFAVPSAAGGFLLKIPPGDLLRPPTRPTGPLVAAVVAGLFLQPALSSLQTGVEWAGREVLGPTTAGPAPALPSLRAALLRGSFPGASHEAPLHVFLQIAVQLPLMEILLHGVLRQAFLRWGALPFVVGTAVLAALLRIQTGIDFTAFGGALVTGLLAARTGSVVPGFAFWTSLYLGWIAWTHVIPAA